jgi:hypothetical protein
VCRKAKLQVLIQHRFQVVADARTITKELTRDILGNLIK